MIADLSRTLQTVLRRPALPPELAAAQVSFDRPQEGFDPDQDTVNLFLCDLHENVELRNNEPRVERLGTRALHRPPPVRLDVVYLATAWAAEAKGAALREHLLLSQLLEVFARLAVLPAESLEGSLGRQLYPVPCRLGPVLPFPDRWSLWGALGIHLRPAFLLTFTLTLEPGQPIEGPVVTQKNLQFTQRIPGQEPDAAPAGGEETCTIGGQVLDPSHAAIAGAAVDLVEAGLHAATDGNGQFLFAGVRPGRYTLQVRKGDKTRQKSVTVNRGSEPNAKGGFDLILK